MWLTTTLGFYSIVQHHKDDQIFLIRARCKKHLKALVKLAMDHNVLDPTTPRPITIDKHRDYWFRLFVSKRQMEQIVTLLVQRISYTNFKKAAKVANMDSSREQEFLSEVWTAGWNLQHDMQRQSKKRVPLLFKKYI